MFKLDRSGTAQKRDQVAGNLVAQSQILIVLSLLVCSLVKKRRGMKYLRYSLCFMLLFNPTTHVLALSATILVRTALPNLAGSESNAGLLK